MARESRLQDSGNSLWGCIGESQECRTRTTEGDTAGAGRIACRDGIGHARDQGSTIRLVQTVVHGHGQEIIVLAMQSVHQQGNAATVEDSIGPAHLGGQDSAGLRGGEFEVGNSYDESECVRKWQDQIAVLHPDSILQGQAADKSWRDIVRMPFERYGHGQECIALHGVPGELVGGHQAPHNRRGTATQAACQRDVHGE